jgi:hypothetical protein
MPCSSGRPSRRDKLKDAPDPAEIGHIALFCPASDLIKPAHSSGFQERF